MEKLTEWADRSAVRIAAGVILAAALVSCFVFMDDLYGIRTFLKGKSSYASMGMLPYGGIYRGIYYVVVVVLIFCAIAVAPKAKSIFSTWGQRTIQVYALHYPIIYVLMQVFHLDEFLMRLWPAHYGWLVPFVAFALTVVLSLKIWSPIFEWLMKPGRLAMRAAKDG
ncbi:MAG: hypothetical protein LUF30_11990 [Lachnospiraceae bacterium]|nr:hypothetical protein [Lachnospiraceae bacterium]